MHRRIIAYYFSADSRNSFSLLHLSLKKYSTLALEETYLFGIVKMWWIWPFGILTTTTSIRMSVRGPLGSQSMYQFAHDPTEGRGTERFLSQNHSCFEKLFLLDARWTNVNGLFGENPTLLQKFDITLPGVNDRYSKSVCGDVPKIVTPKVHVAVFTICRIIVHTVFGLITKSKNKYFTCLCIYNF